MKKKYIIMGLTCMFVITSGICYSCSYGAKGQGVVETLTKEEIRGDEESNTAIITEELDKEATDLVGQDVTEEESEQNIYVHICGAVNKPGVYCLKSEARLVDAIILAGGLTEQSAGDYINQAQLLKDGQRIYIPNMQEVEELTVLEYVEGESLTVEESNNDSVSDNLININTADQKSLMSLPGIGQAKADSIIRYREEKGQFKSTEDLMNVPGIKEGLFNQISSLVIAK